MAFYFSLAIIGSYYDFQLLFWIISPPQRQIFIFFCCLDPSEGFLNRFIFYLSSDQTYWVLLCDNRITTLQMQISLAVYFLLLLCVTIGPRCYIFSRCHYIAITSKYLKHSPNWTVNEGLCTNNNLTVVTIFEHFSIFERQVCYIDWKFNYFVTNSAFNFTCNWARLYFCFIVDWRHFSITIVSTHNSSIQISPNESTLPLNWHLILSQRTNTSSSFLCQTRAQFIFFEL